MFEEFKGRRVEVQMGTAGSFTDRYKGQVIDISDSWIKIKTKKKIVAVNLALVGSIAIAASYEQVSPK